MYEFVLEYTNYNNNGMWYNEGRLAGHSLVSLSYSAINNWVIYSKYKDCYAKLYCDFMSTFNKVAFIRQKVYYQIH